MPRHSPYAIVLTAKERVELEALARQYTSSYRDVVRAKIVLYAAAGLRNDEIGGRLDMPRQIVSKWRKRFATEGMAGLVERSRTRESARSGPRARAGPANAGRKPPGKRKPSESPG